MNATVILMAVFLYSPLPKAVLDFYNGFPIVDEFYAEDSLVISRFARITVNGQPLPFRFPLSLLSSWGFDVSGTRLYIDVKSGESVDTTPVAYLFSRRGSGSLSRIGLYFYRPYIYGNYGFSYDHIELPGYMATGSRSAFDFSFSRSRYTGRLRFIGLTGGIVAQEHRFSVIDGEAGLKNLQFRVTEAKYDDQRFRAISANYIAGRWRLSIGENSGPYGLIAFDGRVLTAKAGYFLGAPMFAAGIHSDGLRLNIEYGNELSMEDGVKNTFKAFRIHAVAATAASLVQVDGIMTDLFKGVALSSRSEFALPFFKSGFVGGGLGGLVEQFQDSIYRDVRGELWFRFSRRLHRSVVLNGSAVSRYRYGEKLPDWSVSVGVELFDGVTISYMLDNYLRYRLTIVARFTG